MQIGIIETHELKNGKQVTNTHLSEKELGQIFMNQKRSLEGRLEEFLTSKKRIKSDIYYGGPTFNKTEMKYMAAALKSVLGNSHFNVSYSIKAYQNLEHKLNLTDSYYSKEIRDIWANILNDKLLLEDTYISQDLGTTIQTYNYIKKLRGKPNTEYLKKVLCFPIRNELEKTNTFKATLQKLHGAIGEILIGRNVEDIIGKDKLTELQDLSELKKIAEFHAKDGSFATYHTRLKNKFGGSVNITEVEEIDNHLKQCFIKFSDDAFDTLKVVWNNHVITVSIIHGYERVNLSGYDYKQRIESQREKFLSMKPAFGVQ